MERLWDFSSWDLGKVAITATAVDFCGSEKRASGEVAVSGDPSCSWCAFWLGESCKHQQFFALFGVLIDWDSDHRTCLLTLKKKEVMCSIMRKEFEKVLLAYWFFPVFISPISPVFLWMNLIQSSYKITRWHRPKAFSNNCPGCRSWFTAWPENNWTRWERTWHVREIIRSICSIVACMGNYKQHM